MLAPSTTTFNGWDASFTVFLNNWLGVAPDFAGHYGTETVTIPPPTGGGAGKVKFSDSAYTFLAGPHFVHHWSRFAPFAQALFGATYQTTTATTLVPVTCSPGTECTGPTFASGGSNGFTMALGGGVDIGLGHSISLRPVQAEYLLRSGSTVLPNNGSFLTVTYHVNEFRYSAGITFHFGPHVGKKP